MNTFLQVKITSKDMALPPRLFNPFSLSHSLKTISFIAFWLICPIFCFVLLAKVRMCVCVLCVYSYFIFLTQKAIYLHQFFFFIYFQRIKKFKILKRNFLEYSWEGSGKLLFFPCLYLKSLPNDPLSSTSHETEISKRRKQRNFLTTERKQCCHYLILYFISVLLNEQLRQE